MARYPAFSRILLTVLFLTAILRGDKFLAVNFSLIMPDVITEVLSSLFTGKTINELLELVSSESKLEKVMV
jgi:hypothetical protein